jgi:hypothetical protein
VLASSVIDYLTRFFNYDNRIPTLFMYCNYLDKEFQTAKNLIASLAKQLLEYLGSAAIQEVSRIYAEYLGQDSRPTITEYSKLLHALLKACTRCFIIVDGLDECEESTQSRLVAELLKLPPNTLLMATSHPETGIKTQLNVPSTIKICASDADLRKFLRKRIKEFPRRIYPVPVMEDIIIDTIVDKARGM